MSDRLVLAAVAAAPVAARLAVVVAYPSGTVLTVLWRGRTARHDEEVPT